MAGATVTFDPIASVPWAVILLVGALAFIVTTTIVSNGKLLSAVRRGLIAVALFAVAIGPSVYGPAERTTFSSSNDIFIVLDTTGSSAAEDWNGDQPRLEGMRSDIREIVDHFAGARFSLITFDAVPLIRVPLTRDGSALISAVDIVQTELTLYSHGSTISEPRDLLADTLADAEDAHPDHRRIVFYLGDGEQTASGDPESFDEAGEYASAGFVLGYGTEEGGRMLVNNGLYANEDDEPEYVMDRSTSPAKVALSTIDESNLREVAEQLGIGYVHRTEPGAIPGLDQIEDIADEAATNDETNTLIPLYWIPALLAFALLLWEAAVVAVAIVNSRAMGRRL